MKIDETDRKILRALLNNPQLSMVELADRVGRSHTPCWRRLKRLEDEGVIRSRALLLDPELLGYPVSVFAHIKIQSHDETVLDEFEESVRSYSEILECFSMSGDADYVLRIVTRSVADYERFLKKVLLHLPGVGSISSSFTLKTVKLTTDIPV